MINMFPVWPVSTSCGLVEDTSWGGWEEDKIAHLCLFLLFCVFLSD